MALLNPYKEIYLLNKTTIIIRGMSVGIRHSQQYNEKMNDSKVYWNMKETNPGI